MTRSSKKLSQVSSEVATSEFESSLQRLHIASRSRVYNMKTTRRKFLNSSITAGLTLAMPRILVGAEGSSKSRSVNDTVRIAAIGMGSTTAVGGVGGRGHQLIPRIREVPGAKIVA